MNPTAIYSKSGKGVQEASGKTSLLKRPDRAVLSAIDGRATLSEVAQKVGRSYDATFQAVIQQLDKDGFIRAVSAGAASAAPLAQPSRPAPAKPASRPAAPIDPASDLDFSSLGATKGPTPPPQRMAVPPTPSRPAAPPPPLPKPSAQQVQQAKVQQSALDKAREEAEAKAAAERERVRREAEEKAKAEIEAKMRADAEKKMKEQAKAAAAAEAEAKVKAAREAALRAAAEAKAEAERKAEEERRAREEMARRLEEERKAKEEAERIRKEAEEKARREAEELRQRLEEERKAREEAERKAKEEAERMRRELEAERQRLEEERRKEEEARAARRRAQEEEDRQRAEQRQREDEERQRQEQERERQRQEAAAQAAAQTAAAQAAAKAQPAKPGGFADSLMADLDSFTNRDDEERKAREEGEREAKAQAERRRREEEAHRQEAERAEREAAEARRREEEEARRRDEEKKAREEEERAREEERRKREAEEIRRKAEAATVAAMAKQAGDRADDIPIGEEDLDMDEVKQERKALGIDEKKEREKAKEAEREAKRKKRAEEKRRREAEKQAARAAVPGTMRPRRSSSWGRPVALLLAIVLVIAIGAAHVVPLDVAPYEQAATEALGQPVRIGSARLWLFTGVQLRFDGVRVGDARVGRVITHPALGSLFGERKHFSLIELERISAPQAAFGEALFSRLKPGRFSVERIVARNLDLKGGLVLPKLDADVALAPDGTLRSATLHGPDGLYARIAPRRGSSEALEFEATAAGFPLPIGPELTLSQFAMKGTATRKGMDIAEWGGAIFNGGISGSAKLRWGSTWDVDGVVTVRAINAAVFAPALLSQGNGEGTGRFSMSSPDPAKLLASSRIDGRFTISQGTLGSFDLSRAIQSRGKQATGTTQFSELTGQGSYDRGTVALRNVTIGAGALNAGASAEISKNGALSGRIVADVKTAAQTLSATLNLGGTVKEPQVRD